MSRMAIPDVFVRMRLVVAVIAGGIVCIVRELCATWCVDPLAAPSIPNAMANAPVATVAILTPALMVALVLFCNVLH